MARKKIETTKNDGDLIKNENENPIEENNDLLKTITPEVKPLIEIKEELIDARRKLRFKKLGGGTLRGIPGYPIIKPGQIFSAYVDDISPRFMSSLQCLDAELLADEIGQRATPAPKETLWKAQQVKPGKWDVIGVNGKPINEVSLSQEEAERLAVALNN